jgi:nanoRNase/pAp phosphatase (c-di-AMP/oligoRNAs hydrolase)
MQYFDVFNGDADGICALLQLRLAKPVNSQLITGVKRDIALLQQVSANTGDKVTVLDISLDKNRQPLLDLLAKQVEVFYVDHHQATDIPQHQQLQTLIDTDANVCTSLLIDRYLNYQFSAWAVTAAFGDNLETSALKAAQRLNLTAAQLNQLRQLGVCINYNGYGSSIADLHFQPQQLYRLLSNYASPLEFIAERSDVYRQLVDAYQSDIAMAWNIDAYHSSDNTAVFILPDEKWARRVSGVWSNELATRFPDRAHAVLSVHVQGGYVVSVRAPLNDKTGADELCARFPGGGGRKAAAGINQLSEQQLPQFIAAFVSQFSR